MAESGSGYNQVSSFPELILENLRVAGVQQAHKEDRITFTFQVAWPGEGRVCGEGRYLEGDGEKREDIFKPQTGAVENSNANGIACWFIDTVYNEESLLSC